MFWRASVIDSSGCVIICVPVCLPPTQRARAENLKRHPEIVPQEQRRIRVAMNGCRFVAVVELVTSKRPRDTSRMAGPEESAVRLAGGTVRQDSCALAGTWWCALEMRLSQWINVLSRQGRCSPVYYSQRIEGGVNDSGGAHGFGWSASYYVVQPRECCRGTIVPLFE